VREAAALERARAEHEGPAEPEPPRPEPERLAEPEPPIAEPERPAEPVLEPLRPGALAGSSWSAGHAASASAAPSPRPPAAGAVVEAPGWSPVATYEATGAAMRVIATLLIAAGLGAPPGRWEPTCTT
jgi:hypothetical protein